MIIYTQTDQYIQDSCDKAKGCVYAPIVCDDKNACTTVCISHFFFFCIFSFVTTGFYTLPTLSHTPSHTPITIAYAYHIPRLHLPPCANMQPTCANIHHLTSRNMIHIQKSVEHNLVLFHFFFFAKFHVNRIPAYPNPVVTTPLLMRPFVTISATVLLTIAIKTSVVLTKMLLAMMPVFAPQTRMYSII